MVARLCVMCHRPMPPRRWWQLLEPPPFHDPSRDPECEREFLRRIYDREQPS